MNSLASYIDHTLLKPEATLAQVEMICREAKTHHFATVCINPVFVSKAVHLLSGSGVAAITVVGFPLGATTTAQKVFETKNSIDLGAQEIDMVIPWGYLQSGDDIYVGSDIEAVVKAAGKIPVKVIIESAALTDDQIISACQLSVKAGAAFVKTSTGFGPGGAKAEHVSLMRKTVGPGIGVKASGGIRSLEDAVRMIEAGASRIGTSASMAIMEAYAKTI